MKLLPVIIVSLFFLLQTCTMQKADTNSTGKKEITAENKEKIDFEKEVLPVLVNNCSPCHFTGGKMYERLPFDKDTTIINHGEKILKRIGKDEKNSIIREFILQNKNGLPGSISGQATGKITAGQAAGKTITD